MLTSIRRNRTVNGFLRFPVKFIGNRVVRIFESMMNRWPVSGIVDLRFHGIDFKMFSNCDDGLVDCLYYDRKYTEERDLKVFLNIASNSKTIIDIGANTGLYTILAAKANPEATVYAFEPYDYNMRRLMKNCALNELTNVQFNQMAVGSSVDTIEFSVPDDNRIIDVASANESFSKHFYKGSFDWKKISVEQVSVDDFAWRELDGKKIDLIKIDVESYEMQVFAGMHDVLTVHQPNILFETFVDEERKTFFDMVAAKYEYAMYVFLENGLLRLDNGIQENFDGLNFLFSKQRSKHQYTSYKEAMALLSDNK